MRKAGAAEVHGGMERIVNLKQSAEPSQCKPFHFMAENPDVVEELLLHRSGCGTEGGLRAGPAVELVDLLSMLRLDRMRTEGDTFEGNAQIRSTPSAGRPVRTGRRSPRGALLPPKAL